MVTESSPIFFNYQKTSSYPKTNKKSLKGGLVFSLPTWSSSLLNYFQKMITVSVILDIASLLQKVLDLRRKSVKKEATEIISKTDKTVFHFKLDDKGREIVEKESFEANPDKISFGYVLDGKNRLEMCSYDKSYRQWGVVFLNGAWINIDKDNLRRLQRLIMRMGCYMGIPRRKRHK